MKQEQAKKDEEQARESFGVEVTRLLIASLIIAALGLFGVTVYAAAVGVWPGWLRVVSHSAFVGGAFGLLGVLLASFCRKN